MKSRILLSLAAAAAGLVCATAAQASTFSDTLSKCLVDKTTDADKALLVKWVFSAISAGPAVKTLATVTPAQRDGFNRDAARLFNRLLITDCRAETVTAIKFDGPSVIEKSFGVLGEVAMQSLMSHPDVNAELDRLGAYFDDAGIAALMKDAGRPFTAPKAK